MRRNNFIFVTLVMALVFAVSGCETVPKKFKDEVTGIKTRVDTLETRVETVESRQAESDRMVMEKSDFGAKTNIETRSGGGKSKEHIKEIQACLKAAGFYEGKIDGVKGKKTNKAIREFQQANGLKVDGVVGKNTGELLARYASGEGLAAEGGTGGTEEGAGR